MNMDTGLETCEPSAASATEIASDEEEELLTLRLAALKSIRFIECQMAPLKIFAATQQYQEPDPVIESDLQLSSNLLKVEIEESHPPQIPSLSLLTSQEMFHCAACPGPVGLLPSFPIFKHVRLHSMNNHLVHLERAVQASTLLPTTLTMYVCKLCPEETENLCLHENEIITHLQKIHRELFVETWWKEFTELQCRVCEIVIEENTIDDHMNTFHPRDLFAEIDDIVKEEIDQNQNLASAQDANLISLTKDFEAVWESFRPENLITKYFPPISGPNLDQDLQTENPSDNARMLPPNLSKTMNLILNHEKIVAPGRELSKLTQGVKTFNLQPNEVVMIGIKKDISVESIRKVFSVNGV